MITFHNQKITNNLRRFSRLISGRINESHRSPPEWGARRHVGLAERADGVGSRNHLAPPPSLDPGGSIRFRRGDRGRVGVVRPAGFTFIEIIVGLAIVLMVATVVTPVLLGRLDAARIETSLKTLDAIKTGVESFENDVGQFPGQLSHLSTAITTSQEDICDNDYSNSEANRWSGPYLDRIVPSTGLRLPIGRAKNQLDELPNNSSNPTSIRMTVDSVAVEDAEELNVLLDGDVGNSTQHNVQWTTPASSEGLVTLYLIQLIDGC